MKRAICITILMTTVISSIGCGQAVSTKKAKEEKQDLQSIGRILGIYPTPTVSSIKFERVGGYPHPVPHTYYSIAISLGHPAVLTKTGRDDVMSWDCNFELTSTERDRLILNLESAYLVRDDQPSFMVDAGNSYLKVLSGTALLGQHPFKDGDSLDPSILLIEGQPLYQQLAELFDRYACIQVN